MEDNLIIVIPKHRPSLELFVLSLCLSLGCQAVLAFGSVRSLIRRGNAGQEIIRVWRVGSPHHGDVPPGGIPPDLQEEAAKLGCILEVRVMPARDLRDSFFGALATNDEPDILVIDNMGMILGITTALGHFEGLDKDASVRASLLNVSESLRSLETHPGWEYLIKTSRHHALAKALAMRKIECSSEEVSRSRAWTDENGAEIRKFAETATQAYFSNDLAALDALVGVKYLDDSLPISNRKNVVSEVQTCGWWANRRVAFVNTVTSFESTDRIGRQSLLVAAANTDGRWRLLMLGDSPKIVDTLQRRAPLLDAYTQVTLEAPMLLKPADQVLSSRVPKDRPELEWTETGTGRPIYLVEWQFRSNREWWGSGFELVERRYEATSTIKIKAMFGVGRQPHRWRIWAINDGGEVARSEWRVVNYIN
jgi:hypothetical protein